jgi:spermidine synthase
MGIGTFRNINAGTFSYLGFDSYYSLSAGDPAIIGYDDDPNSTILVSGQKDGQRGIIVNGKSDGITRGADRITTLMVGHVPALLQSSSSNQAAVIGFGTGITSGALARQDEFTGVHVLEISDAVRKFAPLFDSENGYVSKSPKIKWHHGDAYRYLLSTRTLYGVIASEPSNPWVGGVERLYSQEFYQIARSKLAPGGLFAQWFHRYSISNETLAMVLKTFSSVFPKIYLFETGMDLILIGSDIQLERSNLELLTNRMKRPAIQQDLKDMGITSLNNLLGKEIWIGQQNFSDTPIHTLLHPQLSFAAGRDFFLNRSSDVRRLNQTPPYQYAARAGMLQSLTATHFFHSDQKTFLNSLVSFYCRQPTPQFFNGWEKSNIECQIPLISSLVLGYLPPPNNFGKDFVKNLYNFSPTSQTVIVPAENPDTALNLLNYATLYGAPFIQPSASNLRRIAEVCLLGDEFKHLKCQSQLSVALLANGHTTQALEEHLNLMQNPALQAHKRLAFEQEEIFKGLQ